MRGQKYELIYKTDRKETGWIWKVYGVCLGSNGVADCAVEASASGTTELQQAWLAGCHILSRL